MKLSVIVPVYNVEPFLEQCIESVICQSLRDLEIILVDDGSTDSSPKICDKYALQDSRIKVIHKKNAGLGMARNSGLAIASGEYVTFIDSDDLIDSNAYESLCNMADEHNLDVVRFACNRFRGDDEALNTRYDCSFQFTDSSSCINQLALAIFDSNGCESFAIGGSVCMAIFRRNIIVDNSLQFVSERKYISEDYIFSFLFYLCSRRVGWCLNTYYHYRTNENSLTRTVCLDKIKKAEVYTKYVLSILAEKHMPENTYRYAWGYYISASRVFTRFVLHSGMKYSEKKKWFYQQSFNEYLKSISLKYPVQLMPFKQRICLWAMVNNKFLLVYLMTYYGDKLR